MKHRLYEGWILAREELTPDQKRDLEAHLRECESCKQLAESDMAVSRVFASVQMAEPEPGFANRWKVRLAEKRMRAHRRQTSLVLAVLSFGATAVFLPLLLQAILVLVSPENILFNLAHILVDWLTFLGFIGEIVVTFFNTLFETVPIALLFVVLVSLAVMVVFGGYSLKRLGTLPSRERSSK
jgi:hypothetical protein